MEKYEPHFKKTKRLKKETGLSGMMAPYYDKFVSRYGGLYDRMIQKAKNVFKKQDAILEIGCGTGLVALGIAGSVKSVTAVDASPGMVATAKEKLERISPDNVRFLMGDGYLLPFDNDTFDGVFLINILHVVKEPKALLAEASRLLKPGGFLITATDCYLEPVVSWSIKLLISFYNFLKICGVTYLNQYRKTDIVNLLNENGFDVIENETVNAEPVNYYALGRFSRGEAP